MNRVDKWIYDHDHNELVYVVAEEEGEFLVAYYFADGGYMISDWWDMDPFNFYPDYEASKVNEKDMRRHIKFAFEAEDYFAGGK